MQSAKKPGVGFWATVAVVVVLMGYPLSWGPVTWITLKTKIARYEWAITAERYAYAPLFGALRHAPGSVIELWNGYHTWWVKRAMR
jgi:hypothetical protein